MVISCVDINDGRSGRADIGVGEASDVQVVHLLDPLGGSIDPLSSEDLEVGVVSIVLNISGWGSGEGFFVMQDLVLQTGKSVVEGIDCLLVVFLPFFDGLSETLDDVGKEGNGELGWIALKKVKGGLRGEWRALVVCYALTLPLGRGSQLGLGPRDNGQERNGLPDPGSGPKDREDTV